MIIRTVSVDCSMVYFDSVISEEVLNQVQTAYHALKNLPGMIDLTPSYNSILIHYDLMHYDYQSIQASVKKHLEALQEGAEKAEGKRIIIPTEYCGIDLDKVAQTNHLSVEEVIALHTQTLYRVYAIGFMVGFAYLANVPPQIATPRLRTPRTQVPRGSVAIADNQTAIYPQDSAGGWNIIGHTAFDNFDRFAIGDWVQFVRV